MNPFHQSLKTEASPISLRHAGDYYFSDHSAHGPQGKLCNVTHQSQVMHPHDQSTPDYSTDDAHNHSVPDLDNVKVVKFRWLYEQRWVYQHSYIVLEAELSEFEKSHREKLGLS
jgi:hypothetical protein